jgi:drug/metabolite transporter (DMT)-like permease
MAMAAPPPICYRSPRTPPPRQEPALRKPVFALFYDNPAALLIATTLMWGCNAVAGQLAVGEISPISLVLLRWVMVISVLWPLFGREVRAHWPALRPRIGYVAVMAAVGFTGFNTLFYIASQHTSGVNIGILQGAIPAMVMIGAFAMHRSPVTPVQMLGVVVVLCGAVVVSVGGDLEKLLALALNRGDLIMLIACVFYSFYTVGLQTRPAVPGLAFFTIMAVIATVAAVPMVVWEVASGAFHWPTPKGWAVAVFVAIFPSCLAQIFFMRGVDLIGPGRAGVYANLVPIFAAALATVFLGQQFALHHALALVLVLGGIWLAQKAPRARSAV